MLDPHTDTSEAPRVLVVDPDRDSARALCSAVRAAGSLVQSADGVASSLRAPLTERAILRQELPDGDGLTLLSELLARDSELVVVLLADAPDHALTRAAWQAGALDLFPSDVDPNAVAARLAAAPGRVPRTRSAGPAWRVERLGVERSLRELAAECLRAGLSPTARMRLLSAVSEALDNAWRHAYGGRGGEIELRASFDDRRATVRVADRGRGCDAATVELDSIRAALPGRATPGGIARMRALTDGLELASAPGRGTAVQLSLTDHGAALDGGTGSDLSDCEWLSPSQSKSLMTRVREGRAESLPPALACLVGRLSSCTTDDRRARRALWS